MVIGMAYLMFVVTTNVSLQDIITLFFCGGGGERWEVTSPEAHYLRHHYLIPNMCYRLGPGSAKSSFVALFWFASTERHQS